MRRSSGFIFRDVILNTLLFFAVIIIITIPFINPIGKKTAERLEPPGNVIVNISWNKDIDADVDLWVEAPGDVPVGYSNQSGNIFNVLRDDLGNFNDALKINFENAYSRGAPAGEYIINLHLYRVSNWEDPVDVNIEILVKNHESSKINKILHTTATLTHVGHELTVFRFILDDNGDLDDNSIHNTFIPLRSGRR